MLKPFSMIFFIAVMVWIGGIFVTSDPRTRIDRACVPVTFADSLLVAVVQVIHEPYAMGAHEMMMSVEYGCKFTVWKTFYEEREIAKQAPRPKAAPQQSASRAAEQQVRPAEVSTEKKEQMTEVHVVTKPLPAYLDNK